MKKNISIIIVAVLICIAGCGNNAASIEKPAAYYYCTPPENYETLRTSISYEVRETSVYGEQLQDLLNDYLNGPTSDSLINPFPKECIVESIQQEDTTITIDLNSNFAQLSGVDLILACACMSLTVFELSDCNNVAIRVQNELLDGQKDITLHRDDIILEYIITS